LLLAAVAFDANGLKIATASEKVISDKIFSID